VDAKFPPVRCEGPFAKEHLDAGYVAEQEAQVTRAWRRLQDLPARGGPIVDYPLPEVRQGWEQEAAGAEVGDDVTLPPVRTDSGSARSPHGGSS
jgi:hypothetical protein